LAKKITIQWTGSEPREYGFRLILPNEEIRVPEKEAESLLSTSGFKIVESSKAKRKEGK